MQVQKLTAHAAQMGQGTMEDKSRELMEQYIISGGSDPVSDYNIHMWMRQQCAYWRAQGGDGGEEDKKAQEVQTRRIQEQVHEVIDIISKRGVSHDPSIPHGAGRKWTDWAQILNEFVSDYAKECMGKQWWGYPDGIPNGYELANIPAYSPVPFMWDARWRENPENAPGKIPPVAQRIAANAQKKGATDQGQGGGSRHRRRRIKRRKTRKTSKKSKRRKTKKRKRRTLKLKRRQKGGGDRQMKGSVHSFKPINYIRDNVTHWIDMEVQPIILAAQELTGLYARAILSDTDLAAFINKVKGLIKEHSNPNRPDRKIKSHIFTDHDFRDNTEIINLISDPYTRPE